QQESDDGVAGVQALLQRGSKAPRARQRRRVSALERLQVSDHIANLIRLEPELRHRRMASHDPLGQRPFQAFDRIFEMQRAERRRDRARALADLVDGMALRAMSTHERQTSLCGRRLCEDGWGEERYRGAER